MDKWREVVEQEDTVERRGRGEIRRESGVRYLKVRAI